LYIAYIAGKGAKAASFSVSRSRPGIVSAQTSTLKGRSLRGEPTRYPLWVISGHVRFSGSRVQGPRAYRNAAFSASTAKKIPPSDKANNLAVSLSFIAPELLC
jgi:hypothetical protein